ncbi:P-loop containing nucleoside triphosphate hydrolase protein, partial [Fragilariopsis cylindrus CCMP1102]
MVLDVKRPAEVEKTRVDLPVTAMEFEIMDSIRNNDVTIICGETGSGKSTQIPAYLYEGGMSLCPSDPSKSYMIGITQPRRVAAVSTAKRVCFELGQGDGQSIRRSGGRGNLVSYKTRYESAGSGDSTRIQFMTDGILLSEIQSDLLLRKYSVIVLDESHERNLNTDVLIGLLSVALPLRKKAALEDPSIVPLKLVLMSATLRVEDFTKNARLFPTGPPAVVTVPGRTHPVTIHHSKVTELDDYEEIAFQKICKIHHKLPHGGILVFLTGKAEIIRMTNRLRKALSESESVPKHAYVLPLYSLLSGDEQAKIFSPAPDNHRLIVLATNIAETSITIPGVSYVVDTGRQKCRNYNSGTGVASYDIMWISKASANQRAGRAGRTGPGHCYRLYSSSLFSRHMDDFALPEVLTRPLEDIVLAMKSMNISSVSSFPFPTPPDKSQIEAAVKLLANIGCVDISNMERDGGDGAVTKLGKAVSKLPLGVRYAKILLVAAQAGILDYAIVVVAILS